MIGSVPSRLEYDWFLGLTLVRWVYTYQGDELSMIRCVPEEIGLSVITSVPDWLECD